MLLYISHWTGHSASFFFKCIDFKATFYIRQGRPPSSANTRCLTWKQRSHFQNDEKSLNLKRVPTTRSYPPSKHPPHTKFVVFLSRKESQKISFESNKQKLKFMALLASFVKFNDCVVTSSVEFCKMRKIEKNRYVIKEILFESINIQLRFRFSGFRHFSFVFFPTFHSLFVCVFNFALSSFQTL